MRYIYIHTYRYTYLYVWKKMRAVTESGKLFFLRWNEVTFRTREEQKKIVESDRNIV
jgi:hypothetical protein